MIKKMVICSMLMICFSGSYLFSQNDSASPLPPETTALEKKFKSIDESIDYLRKRNVEVNDLVALSNEAAEMLKDIKTPGENKDYNTLTKFLSFKLTVLEEKINSRTSLAKSINIIYTLLSVFGISIVLIMVVFSVIMYSRRK